MPGEAQKVQRAPKPLTVEQAITFLRSQPPGNLLCVSIPGGPDRCVTGSIAVLGHTRLTTMPGWQPGTGEAVEVDATPATITTPTPTKVTKPKRKRAKSKGK